LFFFSSRRRHTRLQGDWSSDVCSSDLEAFTRPNVMRALARAVFTQSYTYFTWRVTRWELTEYLTELTQSEMKEYFRGNLWPNTPDRKSTRLNSSHLVISYAVFCLKKKN